MDELTEYVYRQENKLQEYEEKLSNLYVENLKINEKVNRLTEKIQSIFAVLRWMSVTGLGASLSLIIFIIEIHIK